jgi:hypothetical protein
VIGKSGLQYFSAPPQLTPGAEGESAFDQLDCFLDCAERSDEQMQMIGHYHKGVKSEILPGIVPDCGDHRLSPPCVPEERLAFRSLCGDDVCLVAAPQFFSSWPHRCPSGAKAPLFVS